MPQDRGRRGCWISWALPRRCFRALPPRARAHLQLWVLFSDRVISLTDGGNGFVSAAEPGNRRDHGPVRLLRFRGIVVRIKRT